MAGYRKFARGATYTRVYCTGVPQSGEAVTPCLSTTRVSQLTIATASVFCTSHMANGISFPILVGQQLWL